MCWSLAPRLLRKGEVSDRTVIRPQSFVRAAYQHY
jgi:hypothetical protein